MKRIILFFCVSLFAFCLNAQNRHELSVFIGGESTDFIKQDDGYASREDLMDMYEPHYALNCGPVLTVTYHYTFNSWLSVGSQFSYGSMDGEIWLKLGSKQDEDFRKETYSLLPEAKFRYCGKGHLRLYGKTAIGLKYSTGTHVDKPLGFAWEVTPAGLEWGGHRFYGVAEFCWGSVIRGGRIGVGFNF